MSIADTSQLRRQLHLMKRRSTFDAGLI
ncbi:hypothetical protein BDI4_190144 [Burkholderia diffusa]|nr:hypothetical protein BDI4_190144 [Burkholderia diffusa]